MRKDYKLERRKYVIGGIVLVIACIYVVRLFSLQVLNDDYKQHADGNAFLKKTQYPSRGLIYDRNGKLLVFNQPAYDVMMRGSPFRYTRFLPDCGDYEGTIR